MIRSVFYFCLFLLLFLVQTSIFPSFFILSRSFDLMLVFILSLSLKFSNIGIGMAIFISGCIMDSVSGGPFGLYLSAYVWIYIIVRSLKSLIHLENIVFLICMGAVAVVVENAFLIFSFLVRGGADAVCFQDLVLMAKQAAWGIVFVPFLLLAVDEIEKVVLYVADRLVQRHFGRVE